MAHPFPDDAAGWAAWAWAAVLSIGAASVGAFAWLLNRIDGVRADDARARQALDEKIDQERDARAKAVADALLLFATKKDLERTERALKEDLKELKKTLQEERLAIFGHIDSRVNGAVSQIIAVVTGNRQQAPPMLTDNRPED